MEWEIGMKDYVQSAGTQLLGVNKGTDVLLSFDRVLNAKLQ